MIFEGIGIEILPSTLTDGNSHLVPHWVFIFLIFITIFYDNDNTYFSILFAIIYGLLIDIVYTDVLGVYMFSYAIVIYIIRMLTKFFHANFYVTVILGMIGVFLVDLTINAIYSVIGIADVIWEEYFFFRLLPTILANMVFLILFYPIFKNRFISWRKE